MHFTQKARLDKAAQNAAKAAEIERSNSVKLVQIAKALKDLEKLLAHRSTDPATMAAKAVHRAPVDLGWKPR